MKKIITLLLILLPLYLFGADLTVTNLHLSSPDDGRTNPTFAWDSNPNAHGYEISADGGLHWSDVGLVTQYTFPNLVGGAYTVVVRAYQNNAVNVPLFGGVGIFLLLSLFGIIGIKKLRQER